MGRTGAITANHALHIHVIITSRSHIDISETKERFSEVVFVTRDQRADGEIAHPEAADTWKEAGSFAENLKENLMCNPLALKIVDFCLRAGTVEPEAILKVRSLRCLRCDSLHV